MTENVNIFLITLLKCDRCKNAKENKYRIVWLIHVEDTDEDVKRVCGDKSEHRCLCVKKKITSSAYVGAGDLSRVWWLNAGRLNALIKDGIWSSHLHTLWWWRARCCWWRTDRRSCSLGDKSPWNKTRHTQTHKHDCVSDGITSL